MLIQGTLNLANHFKATKGVLIGIYLQSFDVGKRPSFAAE